jgi:hypothetical protein
MKLPGTKSRGLYWASFSNERYFERWDEALALCRPASEEPDRRAAEGPMAAPQTTV